MIRIFVLDYGLTQRFRARSMYVVPRAIRMMTMILLKLKTNVQLQVPRGDPCPNRKHGQGTLKEAVDIRNEGLMGQVYVDEDKAPYAKYSGVFGFDSRGPVQAVGAYKTGRDWMRLSGRGTGAVALRFCHNGNIIFRKRVSAVKHSKDAMLEGMLASDGFIRQELAMFERDIGRL